LRTLELNRPTIKASGRIVDIGGAEHCVTETEENSQGNSSTTHRRASGDIGWCATSSMSRLQRG